MEEGQTPKYSITLVFNPTKMKAAAEAEGAESEAGQQWKLFLEMVDTANKLSQERFKVKVGEQYDPDAHDKIVVSPFRKGSSKRKYYEVDEIFVKFNSLTKPGVVDQARQPITQDSGRFVPGNLAHVSYNCFAYDTAGNKGVSFGLGNVQKVADGSPMFTATKPEDDFEVVAAGDDDIPF